jgi:hypothetical protein
MEGHSHWTMNSADSTRGSRSRPIGLDITPFVADRFARARAAS